MSGEPRKSGKSGKPGKPARKSRGRGASPASPPPSGAALADKALDAGDLSEVEAELENLSPSEAAEFVRLIEQAMRKRRILLTGYLLALVAMIGGLVLSLYIYATRDPGDFVGWALLIPFVAVGAILFGFGRWARRQ
jgi:hypothetical protein